jgi:hypothetical protein
MEPSKRKNGAPKQVDGGCLNSHLRQRVQMPAEDDDGNSIRVKLGYSKEYVDKVPGQFIWRIFDSTFDETAAPRFT